MTTKTPDEMQLIMAAAHGWRNVRFDYADGSVTYKSWQGEKLNYVHGPPYYPDSVPSMLELVRDLDPSVRERFVLALFHAVNPEASSTFTMLWNLLDAPAKTWALVLTETFTHEN